MNINSLKEKKTELKALLNFSISLKREISGYYCLLNRDLDRMILYKLLSIGEKDKTSATNYPHVCELKDNVLTHIYFHTHIVSRSPPSGQDIIAMIYKLFEEHTPISMVILPEGVYIYYAKIQLIENLEKLISIDELDDSGSITSLEKYRDSMISNVNNLVRKYHDKLIEIEDYFKFLNENGVEIFFISFDQMTVGILNVNEKEI